MSVTFVGKSPTVVIPASHPFTSASETEINLNAVQGVLVHALSDVKGHEAASHQIEDSKFSLVKHTLEIQTKLSLAMLPLMFNDEAKRLMQNALADRKAGHLSIKLLPGIMKVIGRTAPAPESEVSAPLKRLADSAAKLNEVSDRLTKQIEQIDSALKRLNLGVTAWVTISETRDEENHCLHEELGYARIGSRWGVALRTSSGYYGDPNGPDVTFAAFADAPRQLRIRAVEHIPKLLDQLSADAEAMVANLTPKVDAIGELTSVFQAFDDVQTGIERSRAIRSSETSWVRATEDADAQATAMGVKK